MTERDFAAIRVRDEKPRGEARPDDGPLHAVVALQRGAGNAAVSKLLQRDAVAVEPATGRKTLRYLSRGEDVFHLQSRLNRAPEVTTHLAVDGIFGPKTLAAVRQLQEAHPPLAVDGVVGRETWPVVEAIQDEPADDTPIAKKIFDRGAAAYGAGDFAHAYDFFTRAGERVDRPGLVFSRAQSLRRLGGRRKEAIALYEQYLASGDPARKQDAEAILAELRGPAKTGDEAVDRDAARNFFESGAAHYAAGRYGHAFDDFMAANALYPRPGLIFSAAQSLRRLGARREEAMALYEQYLASGDEARKEDAETNLAELRGPAKTGDEAIDNPAAKALFDRGAALYQAGKYAQAYDEFTKAYALAPRSGITFSRAQALRKLGGRRDEAIALYEQYLASPDATRKNDAEFWLGELKHSGAAP